MLKFKNLIKFNIAIITVFTNFISLNSSFAGDAKASNAQQKQDDLMSKIPHCEKKIGTISVVNGDDDRGWRQMNLAAPQKLIKVMIQKSGCFSLVDRGAGMNAAINERDIGNNLGLQRGSNVGKNQIKSADFVLVAEVAASDSNSGGSNVAGGIAGRLLGGNLGSVVGGITTKKLEADVVMNLTDVRTTESNAFEGHATKNDISWSASGRGYGTNLWGGAVGGGYEDTDIGRIVTQAYVIAYTNMVKELGGITGGVANAPSRSFSVDEPTTMREKPDTSSKIVRALKVGVLLYPTGNKKGIWWEVVDDNENVGWVQNDALSASH